MLMYKQFVALAKDKEESEVEIEVGKKLGKQQIEQLEDIYRRNQA